MDVGYFWKPCFRHFFVIAVQCHVFEPFCLFSKNGSQLAHQAKPPTWKGSYIDSLVMMCSLKLNIVIDKLFMFSQWKQSVMKVFEFFSTFSSLVPPGRVSCYCFQDSIFLRGEEKTQPAEMFFVRMSQHPFVVPRRRDATNLRLPGPWSHRTQGPNTS